MRIFVTGATGFVGSAVVAELIGAGHQVIGLARNEQAEKTLQSSGAEVHKGDLEDLNSLAEGTRSADAVIHTGFIHDFSRFGEVCEIDRKAIKALGNALAGTNRPLIVTSGTLVVGGGQMVTEDSLPDYAHSRNPRAASEQAVDELAERGINVSVVRLSPSVHGDGDRHGFVPMLIDLAKKTRVSAYIGKGENRWTAVHRLDAAALYRLALQNTVPGVRFHGVAEESVTLKSIAEAIGSKLGLPVVSKSGKEASEHFTWFEHFAGVDGPASAFKTREQLNWHTSHPTLLQDLRGNVYF
ncbi:SDR family oxidoreductase [Hufsiella ginkgonis]|uniref:NAD-dependent epimerase/dehydratase family protein n=1 Tax=Hufsiella ginkgonis TaxID=2695274 RepID=A0A7K1XXU3_9SPHI|nr:SDR family oxidoreductase [Hufsiella ginkgonis]MXV15657.1 NAD-dependent epimerase/dehydratase family protein [Hufsiella ginkgonis]